MRIPVNQEERKIVKRLIQGINQDRSEKIKRDKFDSEKSNREENREEIDYSMEQNYNNECA